MMTTTNSNPTTTDTYKAARAAGQSQAEACRTVMAAHGVSMDAAADLCWEIETGGPEPAWVDEAGEQTEASREWDRGFESQYDD